MWGESSSILRSAGWKLAVVVGKLSTVLGSAGKLWWELTSLLRQAGRRKLAVIWWKLPYFLRSAKIWWWSLWSIGSTDGRDSRGIKLMEGRPRHIWRWYPCQIWWWHHIRRQWSPREWWLYNHWRRDHRMVPWEHVGTRWRYVRRGLS